MGAKLGLSFLREEQILRAFENKVLRKILRSKTQEISGDRRKLHNEELHNLIRPLLGL
jgi:hypothetical protein